MKLVDELRQISQQPNNETLLKRFLLDCCEKLLRFRSSDCLPKNLAIARLYLKGMATQKHIHQAGWEIEGDAFGAEYFSDKDARFYFRTDKNIRADLVQIRISTGLNNVDSRRYLIDMAYFIDRVFCYVEHSSSWLFREECEQFICPKLYQKYFG